MKVIQYIDFIKLCNIDNCAEWDQGLRIEPEGIFVVPPSGGISLSPSERAALSWHPTGDYSKPALPFPCTVEKFQEFILNSGLSECYAPEQLHEMIRREMIGQTIAVSKEPTDNPQIKTLENCLIDTVCEFFWGGYKPSEHNRPTKKQITGWLMIGYEKDGLTKKAAERVYIASRPDNVPKHGNLSTKQKPFPDPPYPI